MRKFNLLIVPFALALLMVHWGCTNDNRNNMKTNSNEDNVNIDHSEVTDTTKVSYLALGDSYTIGESVPESERWPVQLSRRLSGESFKVEPVRIIARTGWTTGQLLDGIDRERIEGPYDVVSLLIGVNNQYQGLDFGIYRTQFDSLLRTSIDLARGRKEKVFVLSIPNYGVTPFAASRDTARIRREIDRYNEVADSICQSYGVAFFNITPISRRAGDEPSLVASDGLHPSGKQYRLWVDHIEDSARTIFSE
ncbi:MAG: SGNH/GDSL hydrolase family protein [Bacteroidales bacterium]|nr:SGNH/GDSL hydrolase family protein [Bacteroidales bacterium]